MINLPFHRLLIRVGSVSWANAISHLVLGLNSAQKHVIYETTVGAIEELGNLGFSQAVAFFRAWKSSLVRKWRILTIFIIQTISDPGSC